MLKPRNIFVVLCVLLCLGLNLGGVVHAADVKVSLGVVFGHEGGLQCDPHDPGNWTGGKVGLGRAGCTKYGIATVTYPREDIRHLSIQRAALLYERDFWTPLRLSDFRSQGLATEVFDTAVNMGVGTSANIVLKTINYLGPAHYKMTGHLNPEQAEWINKYTKRKVRRVKFWKILNVYQAERYMSIINHNEKMRQYEDSWFSRVGG
jgi:lysozyme family protein